MITNNNSDRGEILNRQINSENVGSEATQVENAQAHAQWFLDWADERVHHIYAEEIKEGDIAGKQLDALVILEAIKGTDRERQSLTQTQLYLMYKGFTEALFHHAGFATFEEWLDSRGIDLNDGKFNQLKSMAVFIIPWCEANGVYVNGNRVTVDWFAREVEGKCLTSRTRHAVSTLRDIIDAPWSVNKKKDEIATILSWIENPQITNEVLKENLGVGGLKGIAPPAITVWSCNGSFHLEIELTDPRQLKWLRARLPGVQFTVIEGECLLIDQSQVWLNDHALVDLRNEAG